MQQVTRREDNSAALKAETVAGTPGGGAVRTSSRIPSLDGLRAVSIFLVLMSHIAPENYAAESKNWTTRIAVAILGNGTLGVQVFFVISGFLITHLLLNELSRHGRISLKHFYIRRVFRICPAFYFLIFTVGVLAFFHVIDTPPGAMAHAATFTWLYNFKNWNWYLAHSWSLSVEEQFYLFWPTVLVIVGPRRAVWVAIFFILFVPFTRAGMVMHVPRTIHRLCYIISAARFDLLMFGCLAALAWRKVEAAFAKRRWLAGVVTSAFVLAALATAAFQLLFLSIEYNPVFAALSDTVIGMGIILGIAYVVAHPRSLIGYVLNMRFLCWIGVLSYSLYLWQQLFLTHKPTHSWQHLPLSFLLAFAAGVSSFYFIEKPMLRMRVRLFRDPAASGPAI